MKPGVIELDGTCYETTLDRRYLNRKSYQAPDANLIQTQIPGTVHELCVKAGDTVKAGQKLAIFIAMKMHNIILAPNDGRIVSVDVAVGDKVPKGQILFVME